MLRACLLPVDAVRALLVGDGDIVELPTTRGLAVHVELDHDPVGANVFRPTARTASLQTSAVDAERDQR